MPSAVNQLCFVCGVRCVCVCVFFVLSFRMELKGIGRYTQALKGLENSSCLWYVCVCVCVFALVCMYVQSPLYIIMNYKITGPTGSCR